MSDKHVDLLKELQPKVEAYEPCDSFRYYRVRADDRVFEFCSDPPAREAYKRLANMVPNEYKVVTLHNREGREIARRSA